MMAEQPQPSLSVAVYLRVSGEDQKRKGTIENQRPDLDRYLAAYGLAPYGWYQDEAVSGHWVPFPERPQGRRLLADAQAGHVTLVLVWRLDRFGRNAVEILKAVEELEQAGARLVSLKEQFDTRTAAGKLMLGILAAVAEFEWDSIMERSEAGTQRKLARADGAGWMGGRIPYGYRVEGKEDQARLILDDTPLGIPDFPQMTAADVVRLIYQLTVEEKQSARVIADKLNAMGVPTAFARRGLDRFRHLAVDKPVLHLWQGFSVTSILRNPTYKGLRPFGRRARHPGHTTNGRGTVVTYSIPALVSVETWDAAQRVLASHRFWTVRNEEKTRDFLLAGMLTCAACGRHYIGHGARYSCIGRVHAPRIYGRVLAATRRCDALTLPKAQIEAEIWASADYYIHHPDEVHAQVAAELSGQADTSAQLRAQLASKQQEQDAKQSQRDSILTYFRTGNMTETDLTRQLALISAEQAKCSAQIAALTRELAAADETAARLAGVDAFLADLLAQYDAEPLTQERKRAILEQFIAEMTVRTEVDEETGLPRPVVHVRWTFERPDSGPAHVISIPRDTRCSSSPDSRRWPPSRPSSRSRLSR
jgi:site-specific DNA recombinase